MPSFNHYFNNDFAGCRLLAYARDNCRNRDVRVYMIPGSVDCVGVSDGVDKWIAPVIANPFSVNVQDLIRKILAGEDVPKPSKPQEGGKSGRRALLGEPPNEVPTPRKRIALIADIQPTRRTRRVLATI